MKKSNRRAFIATSAALTAAPLALANTPKHAVPKIVHHVFFWLRNPESTADRDALIAGVRTLGEIPTVRGIHVGVPASTEKRDVVDNSFQVSEILYFDDLAGQATYQTHPIHMAFVEKHSHLWDKVVVYDSVSA